VTFGKVVG